jgi:hypothetical protein
LNCSMRHVNVACELCWSRPLLLYRVKRSVLARGRGTETSGLVRQPASWRNECGIRRA